jgi:ATP-dependent DNA ligase
MLICTLHRAVGWRRLLRGSWPVSIRSQAGFGHQCRGDEKLPVAKPELVAQIDFAERTPDQHLRHSKFVGLREDKWEVVRE